MTETSKTFKTDEEAAAFMLGFSLATTGVDCYIDPEEPNAVLINLEDEDAVEAYHVALEDDRQHRIWLQQRS